MQWSLVGLCRKVVFESPHWRPRAPVLRESRLITAGTLNFNHLDRLSRFFSCCWSTVLARRDGPTMASASAYFNHLPSRASDMQPHHLCIPFASVATRCTEALNTKCMDTSNIREKAVDDDIYANPAARGIWFPHVYKNSTHRDGAIYENMNLRKEWFDVDITDRTETLLEPAMLSKATEECSYDLGYCLFHFPRHMLQFFSVTLACCPVSNAPLQLYGYIAVRDLRDWMLNYVVNHSRDNPIFVQQGSLIEMTGPKRAIDMVSPVLIEFDMRIKNGEQEKDDLELIDGAFAFRDQWPCKSTKHRINGKYGAIDISLAYIEHAVEATIEISISEVHMDFSLSLSSYIYVLEYEEISLFNGTIGQSCGQGRFVVAVMMDTVMLLKFKVGNDNVVRYRTFKAKQHGSESRKIKLHFATFSVKVTWSTI
ncbi:hypothetical protein PR202_ga09858 [Eleusine coracana subsp. coracana]|uniref:DUF6598 domain-containing protein n=1 Tax=Eleusine coracana subsp. coracana TaxID=191504 RepID=A0AAV5C5F5_ELECO|nr:hypothetical protein PR202_ga09858 [Eleusine coracana subsp. coracana]